MLALSKRSIPLLKKAPNVTDGLFKARLDALRGDDDNNSIPPLPLPPTFFPPPSPPLLLPPTNFPPPTNYPGANLPPPGLFQPTPIPTPSFPLTGFSLPTNNQLPTIRNVTNFGEIEAMKGEKELPKVKNEIDELMKSIPSLPRLELNDEILNVSKDAENVIDNDFVKVEENDDKDIQETKDGYNFDDIDEFDNGKVPEILEFFCGGDDNEKFRINCEMLGLTGDNSNFIDFLCSPAGEQMMQENSMSIHLESGNLFYYNFNTQENFYDFLLNQYNKNKLTIKTRKSILENFQTVFARLFYKVLIMKKLINLTYFLTKTQNIYFTSLMLI